MQQNIKILWIFKNGMAYFLNWDIGESCQELWAFVGEALPTQQG